MTERLPSSLLLAPDARAAERELLAEVERAQAGDRLARVTIVVPSSELRRHVLARLVEGGRARLGVQVLTLPALAHAVLDRVRDGSGGEELSPRALRAGELLFPLFVERRAAKEKALASSLAAFENGYGGATGSVRDLLDAGFSATDLEPALEALAEERARHGEAVVERARALVRVAADVLEDLARHGVAIGSGRLHAAAEAIARDGDAALPVRRAIVHGFADATGAASSLLERLFRAAPTTAILCQPPPLDPATRKLWRFGSRLRERFEGIATPEPVPPEGAASAVELAGAGDLEREVAAALSRAALAIADGVRPERIAIVARDLSPYRSILEREIDRRGIAASGSAGGEHPAARRARAWRELLARRGESTIELVLAATATRWERRAGTPAEALRQAALRAGLLRLADLAAPAPEGTRESPPLPRMRKLAGELLVALEALSRPQRLAKAAALLRRALGDDDPSPERLVDPLADLEGEPLASLKVTAEELGRLLDALWADAGSRPLGGEGGGLALLTVTEARALSFDRLLLLGLARDRFPRRIRADPFLPDALRVALRAAGLADLPVKSEGHDEERFLFAQLLGASAALTISWPESDESGRELAPSTLVDELERSSIATVEAGPPPAPPAGSALDRAIADSLAGGRLGSAFEAAVEESAARFATSGPLMPAARSAAFRNAVVAEYGADPGDAARRGRLGPYFGFAGAAGDSDRRDGAPWITVLESLAACGWRTFLEKLLHLDPPATPADELPTLPSTLAGNVVHRVLESMLPREFRFGDLATVLARRGLEVAWPAEAELEESIRTAAVAELRSEGIDPALFALPLAAAAREFLDTAREADWLRGSRRLLGVEATGETSVPAGDGARRVRFRVDRVELDEVSGRPLLTDYKTGRALSTAKTPEKRAEHLEKAVAQGRTLQLAAYALADAAPSGTPPPLARLLYLKTDLEPEAREVLLESGGPALAGAPWSTLFAAWDRGAFLPRLLEETLRREARECDSCDVRVACLQGDTGARSRLRRWASGAAEGEPSVVAEARALFALRKKGGESEGDES